MEEGGAKDTTKDGWWVADSKRTKELREVRYKKTKANKVVDPDEKILARKYTQPELQQPIELQSGRRKIHITQDSLSVCFTEMMCEIAGLYVALVTS